MTRLGDACFRPFMVAHGTTGVFQRGKLREWFSPIRTGLLVWVSSAGPSLSNLSVRTGGYEYRRVESRARVGSGSHHHSPGLFQPVVRFAERSQSLEESPRR